MSTDFFPFALVPLLVWTYFWINPLAFTTLVEGLVRYLAETYLGYKAWRIAVKTQFAYWRYQRNAKAEARRSGYSNSFVKAYLSTYEAEDWKILKEQQKRTHEEKYEDLEKDIADMLLF